MARDIEEFLRKAAERRNQQLKQGQQPARPPQQAPAPPPVPQKPQWSRAISEEPEIIEDVEVLDEPPATKKGAKQGQQRPRQPSDIDRDDAHPSLGPSRFNKKKSPQLGRKVSDVTKNFERAVHDHLDHDISKVETAGRKKSVINEPTRAPAPQTPMAAGLRKMLARPETIGQAILVSEILKRPNFDD